MAAFLTRKHQKDEKEKEKKKDEKEKNKKNQCLLVLVNSIRPHIFMADTYHLPQREQGSVYVVGSTLWPTVCKANDLLRKVETVNCLGSGIGIYTACVMVKCPHAFGYIVYVAKCNISPNQYI